MAVSEKHRKVHEKIKRHNFPSIIHPSALCFSSVFKITCFFEKLFICVLVYPWGSLRFNYIWNYISFHCWNQTLVEPLEKKNNLLIYPHWNSAAFEISQETSEHWKNSGNQKRLPQSLVSAFNWIQGKIATLKVGLVELWEEINFPENRV